MSDVTIMTEPAMPTTREPYAILKANIRLRALLTLEAMPQGGNND